MASQEGLRAWERWLRHAEGQKTIDEAWKQYQDAVEASEVAIAGREAMAEARKISPSRG